MEPYPKFSPLLLGQTFQNLLHRVEPSSYEQKAERFPRIQRIGTAFPEFGEVALFTCAGSLSDLSTIVGGLGSEPRHALVNIFFYMPTIYHSLFCIFFMIAAFHGNLMASMDAREDKLYLLSSRYLFIIKVYHVAPITRKMDTFFLLELFVCFFLDIFSS